MPIVIAIIFVLAPRVAIALLATGALLHVISDRTPNRDSGTI